jgi:AraC family transcriptional regulator
MLVPSRETRPERLGIGSLPLRSDFSARMPAIRAAAGRVFQVKDDASRLSFRLKPPILQPIFDIAHPSHFIPSPHSELQEHYGWTHWPWFRFPSHLTGEDRSATEVASGASSASRGCLFARFPAAAPSVVASTLQNSTMFVGRLGMGRSHKDPRIQFDPQDVYYVVFQLQNFPSHPYWENGRPRPAPAAPRGCLHIADLRETPSCVLNGSFDSLHFQLPRGFLEALAADGGLKPVQHLREEEAWTTRDPVLAQLAPLFIKALDRAAGISHLFAEQLAIAAALHVSQTYGGVRAKQPTARGGTLAPWQERRARDIIAADLVKETTLAEIAAECALSLSHFSKAFKATTGFTPNGWLQTCRVDRSCELLRDREATYAEISLMCGFCDQSHFIQTFKRVTGLTPRAWRRANTSLRIELIWDGLRRIDYRG